MKNCRTGGLPSRLFSVILIVLYVGQTAVKIPSVAAKEIDLPSNPFQPPPIVDEPPIIVDRVGGNTPKSTPYSGNFDKPSKPPKIIDVLAVEGQMLRFADPTGADPSSSIDSSSMAYQYVPRFVYGSGSKPTLIRHERDDPTSVDAAHKGEPPPSEPPVVLSLADCVGYRVRIDYLANTGNNSLNDYYGDGCTVTLLGGHNPRDWDLMVSQVEWLLAVDEEAEVARRWWNEESPASARFPELQGARRRREAYWQWVAARSNALPVNDASLSEGTGYPSNLARHLMMGGPVSGPMGGLMDGSTGSPVIQAMILRGLGAEGKGSWHTRESVQRVLERRIDREWSEGQVGGEVMVEVVRWAGGVNGEARIGKSAIGKSARTTDAEVQVRCRAVLRVGRWGRD